MVIMVVNVIEILILLDTKARLILVPLTIHLVFTMNNRHKGVRIAILYSRAYIAKMATHASSAP